jgi:hypothetical protein
MVAHLKMAASEVQRFFVFTAGLRSFQIDDRLIFSNLIHYLAVSLI